MSISDKDVLDLSSPVDENTYLATNFLTDGGKVPSQFGADDSIGSDPALVSALK